MSEQTIEVLEEIKKEIDSLKTSFYGMGTTQCYWHDVGLNKAKGVIDKYINKDRDSGLF